MKGISHNFLVSIQQNAALVLWVALLKSLTRDVTAARQGHSQRQRQRDTPLPLLCTINMQQ
jgi:hypothetical protein